MDINALNIGENRQILQFSGYSYQEMKNAFSLLKVIQLSQNKVKEGKVKTAEKVFSDLRKEFNINGN